ncbi:ABC transporter permease [Microbacteriaceae bacterium VKM Ac-2854]|nr:ABC transporter permease [Microbacteriaceae bacterium VKM Ac-2854]
MFVALRDLRFARGRFILIGSVVALITVLVGFLSGLTGGLAIRNISAVVALPGDRLVFASGTEPSFADSVISPEQAAGWASAVGVDAAVPIGISQTSAESASARTSVAVFGVEPGFDALAPENDGRIGLSAPAASELGVVVGDTVRIAGADYTVATVAGDAWYSHTPVVAMTLGDWRASALNPGGAATVLSVTGSPDWTAADAANATESTTVLGSLTALSAFRSEIGSLLLIVALLFGISGLVIGAFFTVWTLQRSGDIAVLKALGASTPALIRDALGQALLVLVLGIGVGLGVVAGVGGLISGSVPFLLHPSTTVLPGVLMAVLGLAGAAFAVRSVTSADPLTALGSNR